MKYKFDEPIPTKSGRRVVDLWKELPHTKQQYRMYLMIEKDKINAIITAKKIRKLQEDLGITLDQFPELRCFN